MASIIVRFKAPGLHCWPDAPENRSYLRRPHRHLFHVEVKTHVKHDEREIEFHDLLDAAKLRFCSIGDQDTGVTETTSFDTKSCEVLARILAADLSVEFERAFEVSVFEDGECGATVAT